MVIWNEERCVGCAICIQFCPLDALESWGPIVVNGDRCNDCLECIEYCPVDALEVKE